MKTLFLPNKHIKLLKDVLSNHLEKKSLQDSQLLEEQKENESFDCIYTYLYFSYSCMRTLKQTTHMNNMCQLSWLMYKLVHFTANSPIVDLVGLTAVLRANIQIFLWVNEKYLNSSNDLQTGFQLSFTCAGYCLIA